MRLMNKIYVVIRDGMFWEAYSNTPIEVEVIDMDTQDLEEEEYANEMLAEMEAQVEDGTLINVYLV